MVIVRIAIQNRFIGFSCSFGKELMFVAKKPFERLSWIEFSLGRQIIYYATSRCSSIKNTRWLKSRSLVIKGYRIIREFWLTFAVKREAGFGFSLGVL